jgi:carboxylate-amine ligase
VPRTCSTTPGSGGSCGPHPRLGTVEVRALDAQASLEDTAGLVALVHCLARHAAEARPEPDPAAEVLDEGAFRAARFGVSARLPDAQGRLRPVDELLQEALALADRYGRELRCTDQLDALPALLARGGGAGRQRAYHQIAGMDALLRDLTKLTCAGTAPPAAR